MRIGLLDTEKLIKTNNIKEVTSPIMSSTRDRYDPDGIFSNDIFGSSKVERRTTYGYIDLKNHFLHPHIYQNVLKKGVFREIVSLVSGTKQFVSINGKLTITEEVGWTGVHNLYNHWDEIDWTKLGSNDKTSIKLLNSLSKEEAFISKELVCPPAFRDISFGASDSSEQVHELNTYYTSLIRAINMLQEGGIFAKTQYATQAKVQELLADIFNYCQSQLSKKSGLIHQFLLGKRVDYGTRSVISAPSYSNETIDENMIGLEYTAMPISQCCAAFMPFIESWLRNFFTREIINSPAIVFYDNATHKTLPVSIKDPDTQFSDKEINRMILDFIKNPNNRFKVIEISGETNEGGYRELFASLYLKGKLMNSNKALETLNRPLTITDLLYLACVDVCERRHVVVTRYPVGTDKGLFINKIRVQSTRDHINLIYNGKEYPFYPKINLNIEKDKVGIQFVDTVVFSNSMLKGLGGD